MANASTAPDMLGERQSGLGFRTQNVVARRAAANIVKSSLGPVDLDKRANDLVKNKIHPTSIISVYRIATREACKYVDEKLAVKVDKLRKDSLVNCAKTSMSSKLIARDSDFFANLVVDAVQAVGITSAHGEVKYPIKGINILKAHGKSARDSYLMNGYALNTGLQLRKCLLEFPLQR